MLVLEPNEGVNLHTQQPQPHPMNNLRTTAKLRLMDLRMAFKQVLARIKVQKMHVVQDALSSDLPLNY